MSDQVTEIPKPLKIKKKGAYGISIFFASILITQLIFSIILHHNYDNQNFTLTTMGSFFFLEILLLLIIFIVFSQLRENPKGTFFSVWRYAFFIFCSILVCSITPLFILLGGNDSNLKDDHSKKIYKESIDWSLGITSLIVGSFLILGPMIGAFVGLKSFNLFAYDDVSSEIKSFEQMKEENFYNSTSTGKDNLNIYKVQLDIVQGKYDDSIFEWNNLFDSISKGQNIKITENIKEKQKNLLKSTNPELDEALLSSVLAKDVNGNFVTSDGKPKKNYEVNKRNIPQFKLERDRAIENINNNYQKSQKEFINKYSNSVYQDNLIGRGSNVIKFLAILIFCIFLGFLLHTEHTRNQLFKFNKENDIANISRWLILGIIISSAVIFTLATKNKFFFVTNLILYFIFLSLLIINRKNYGIIQVMLLLLIISFIFSEIIYDKLLKTNKIVNYKDKIEQEFKEKEDRKEEFEKLLKEQNESSIQSSKKQQETNKENIEEIKKKLAELKQKFDAKESIDKEGRENQSKLTTIDNQIDRLELIGIARTPRENRELAGFKNQKTSTEDKQNKLKDKLQKLLKEGPKPGKEVKQEDIKQKEKELNKLNQKSKEIDTNLKKLETKIRN